MIKDNIIWVKIKTYNYNGLFIKLNRIGINIYDSIIKKEYILIKITYHDYSLIKKYLISYESSIYKKTGLGKIKELGSKYIVFIISIILSIVLLFIVNNLIFKIEIKSNNESIIKLIEEELYKHNIKIFTLKKRHTDIEVIVKEIINDNEDILEWMEIKYDGLILIVNVEEKIKKEIKEEYSKCNIIASSDAKIISMNVYRGTLIKDINDYVNKGDIILSGEVIHNEEVKNNVCANGEVYGEVWYTVKVNVPFKEDYIEYTGKDRYNLRIRIDDNKYTIFRNRIDKRVEEEINLYKLDDFEVNLVKEREYINKTKVLSEEEAYNKAIRLVEEKVSLQLLEEEQILLKKVLKKEVNDSTIYLEVFVVTKEEIGELQVVGEDYSDGSRINT